MKKVMILLVFILLSTPVYAKEITVNDSETDTELPSAEEIVPPEVTEILTQNGVSLIDGNVSENIFAFILSVLSGVSNDGFGGLSKALGLVVISLVVSRIIDKDPYKKIISYITMLAIAVSCFGVFKLLIADMRGSLQAVDELLSAILPAFSATLLLSGGAFSSIASSASLGAVLTLLEVILSNVIAPCVSLMLVFSVFERLSPELSAVNAVSSIKKHIISAITFVTMLMLTVISFQTILASSKDSVSMRSVKFAAANFIPIVGSAVGEAFKTVSAGMRYLKTTLGISSAVAILLTVLPTVIKLFFAKLWFGILAFFSGTAGASSEKAMLNSFSSVIDIMLSIIICVSVLSVLVAVLFATTSISVGA